MKPSTSLAPQNAVSQKQTISTLIRLRTHSSSGSPLQDLGYVVLSPHVIAQETVRRSALHRAVVESRKGTSLKSPDRVQGCRVAGQQGSVSQGKVLGSSGVS